MSLSIPQRFITDIENFSWGVDWRATRIIRERRVGGDYYFANIIRYYGEKEDTHDYDVSESLQESAWLGRIEKFVGKRMHDIDPDSKTFGKRIYSEAITETITEKDGRGKPVEREVLIDGKVIYEYIIPATKENTEKMKGLAGAIALNQETQFLFIYGANAPIVVEPETFWTTTVSDYLKSLTPTKPKKDGKKV